MAASCTTAGAPQGFSGSGYYQAGSGEWGERNVFELQLMPAAWFELESESTVQGGPTPGSADGWGYGVRAAFGNRDQSIGVLYQGFDLDADFASVELHSVYVDFDVRLPLQEGGGKFALQAAGGLGAMWLDYGQRYDDSNEGAAQLRVAFVFEPYPSFSTSLGVGGVWIGHPGNTEGYGTFLLLGAALTF